MWVELAEKIPHETGTHAHTRALTCTDKQTDTHTHTDTHIHTHRHTHTHMHNTHTHTHTHLVLHMARAFTMFYSCSETRHLRIMVQSQLLSNLATQIAE